MNIKVECKGQSRNEKFSVVTFQGVFMMINIRHPMISKTKYFFSKLKRLLKVKKGIKYKENCTPQKGLR